MASTMNVSKRKRKVEVRAIEDLNVARNIKNVTMVQVVNYGDKMFVCLSFKNLLWTVVTYIDSESTRELRGRFALVSS